MKIDPPYNTGSAFEHYDDNLEHSTWLSLMKPRLEILRNLLSDDGSIWISIDEEEFAYLKVLCDEIFGRINYLLSMPRVTKRAGKSTSGITKNHDYIIVYSKNKNNLVINQLDVDLSDYPLKDEYYQDRGGYKLNQTLDYGSIQYSPSLDFEIVVDGITYRPGGVTKEEMFKRQSLNPKSDFCWRWSEDLVKYGLSKGFIVVKGNRLYTKTYTKAKIKKVAPNSYDIEYVNRGKNSTSLDFTDNIYSNDNSRKNIEMVFGYKAFDYAKPESLIERILTLATNENDLILDSFLGSCTTAAVAHKMNRRYIGIEMGEHAYSLCKVRLDNVIDGDKTGISKSVGWPGGGAYKFYELAPSLINHDDFDEPIINPDYDKDMLASAVALHEGFTYSPNKEMFWKQSIGSENSYLFVTTRHLTKAFVESIHISMEDSDHLIIACKSFETGLDKNYPQITIKKIPQMLLARCEFGKDNYNLNIINPPIYEEDVDDEA